MGSFDDGRDESSAERADRNWDELLQELRVMQTGTQILTGFLLAVAFQPRFSSLAPEQVGLYVVLVALAAIATILAVTPVCLHRALFRQHRKAELVDVTARIVAVDLIVIGLLTVGVTTLIVDFTIGRTAGIATLVCAVLLVAGLWYAVPGVLRRTRRGQGHGL
ncbi:MULTISPECIES: DUF6328 family protein [Bacteria]|uniref:DUF6328 family protein n=1 Tax=Bacteria TaxID=2 RepID=UPI003C7B4FEB